MTDREMLELAARAIDVCFSECLEYDVQGKRKGPFIVRRGKWVEWNPLTDDGDALRLAVNLFLTVEIWSGSSKHKQGVTLVESDEVVIEEPHNGDANTATRRAIVRAAAGIGKQMEENT